MLSTTKAYEQLITKIIREFECQRKIQCCDVLLSNHYAYYFHGDLYQVVPNGPSNKHEH